MTSRTSRRRSCWFRVALVVALPTGLPTCVRAQPTVVRVMAMVTSEWEARPWLAELSLSQDVAVPGIPQPVRCTRGGVCLAILGEGPLSAAGSVMSLGLSANLDLTRSYILVAGIAGTDPTMATIGSVAWVDWVVDADSAAAAHPEDLPHDWEFPRFRKWCSRPWCEDSWGVNALRVNPTLVQRAVRSSETATLLDDARAQAARARYPQEMAKRAPSVVVCSSLSGATYWHGPRMSEWASWWVGHWTEGTGRYCVTDEEDFAVFSMLQRLSSEGRVDVDRVLVLRGAGNFDQPHPGQSTVESLRMKTDDTDPELAIENVWRVARPMIRDVVAPRISRK
jgi:purine nucleoside permease